jgi:type IX secretion system PorP/SprF family membrane protein
MKTRFKFFLLIALFFGSRSFGQDLHFSQPGDAPLNLSPALAGLEYQLRTSVNYRSQWRAVPSAFNTSAASADFQIYHSQGENARLALGFEAMSDRAGEPVIVNNIFNIHLAGHIKTGFHTTLSASLFAGYRQVSIDPANGQWASQYDGFAYDGNIASGENFSTWKLGGINCGTGMVFSYSNQEKHRTIGHERSFMSGISVYNLNGPVNSFIESQGERLPIRAVFFASGKFTLANLKGSIAPAIYFQRQGTQQELIAGSSFIYHIRQPSRYTSYMSALNIGTGILYRAKDATIAKLFMDMGDLTFGFSYDINTSRLHPSTDYRGGFEIFIRYAVRSTGKN